MTSLIIQGNFKGIGFDVMGLDPLRDNNLNRHKALFKDTDIVNIENLTHLEQCGDELFWLSCFPLKIENCEGFLFERLLGMNKDRITGLSIFSFHYIIVYQLQ